MISTRTSETLPDRGPVAIDDRRRVDSGRQRPVRPADLAPEPSCAERVSDVGGRVPHEERGLQRERESLYDPACRPFVGGVELAVEPGDRLVEVVVRAAVYLEIRHERLPALRLPA